MGCQNMMRLVSPIMMNVKRIAQTIHLTSGLSVKAKVVGFDEVNNWIILDVIESPNKEITGR